MGIFIRPIDKLTVKYVDTLKLLTKKTHKDAIISLPPRAPGCSIRGMKRGVPGAWMQFSDAVIQIRGPHRCG